MGKRGPGVRWSFGVSTKMSKPNDLDWSVIEDECERKFPTTFRSAIDALLHDYNDWLDVGRAGWTDAELKKAAKKVESAIFKFREMVIDGKFLPDHPEGAGVAQVSFASRAHQAEILARRNGLLDLKSDGFRVALSQTDDALRALLASITPIIERGAKSPVRHDPETEAWRVFVVRLTNALKENNIPYSASKIYPDKSPIVRLLHALGLGRATPAATAKAVIEARKRARGLN